VTGDSLGWYPNTIPLPEYSTTPTLRAGVAGDRTLSQCLGYPRVATARRLSSGVGLVFVAQPCEELELVARGFCRMLP
jgi:hypothetical protein